MKVTNETVLFYQLQPEKAERISGMLVKMGIKGKAVSPEEYGLPIGSLVGLRVEAAQEEGEPFSQEMLVMSGLSSKRINQFLAGLRQAGVTVDLKAVVTQQNQYWSSYRLYKEISQEHSYMTKQQK